MHILVLHRVPDSFVRYAENLDHDRHDVVYVSAADRVATLPRHVRATFRERPGIGDTAEEVLAAVADLPRPDLVIALSEYDLLAAGRVRAVLDVAGPKDADVLPVRDKVVMKTAVLAAGLRVPRFVPLPTALAVSDAVPWSGPTVLKPLAGASAEDVRAFPTAELALVAARDSDIAVDDFEIEEFVDGPIFHVDGLLADGKLVAVLASRYLGTCLAYAEGSPLGSVQVDTDAATAEWTQDCLSALGLVDGPFHLEGIETPDGPVFLEVGARFGGADVVDTFELATGVHLPSAQLQLLVGGPRALPPARVPGPADRYGWFTVPGHTLGADHCRIDGAERFRDDPIVHRWVQRTPDEPIKRVITYADSDIPIAGVVGPGTSADLERFLTEMFQTVVVEGVQ